MKRTLLAICVTAPIAFASMWSTHGPRGGAVRSLAAAPSDHDIVYVTAADGVFRTEVGTGQWTDITGPIIGPGEIAVSGTDPNIVLVGASNGVFRTANGGTSWQLATGIPSGTVVTRLLIDPTDARVVYAASGTSPAPGVYKSVDGGRTFGPSNRGLGGASLFVRYLALDPVSPNRLHLYYLFQGDVWGHATSQDGAATWSVRPFVTPDAPIGDIVASPREGSRRYGLGFGFFTSDDGEHWTLRRPVDLRTSQEILFLGVLAIDPFVPRLFTGTASGAWRSADGGRTWLPLQGAGQGDAISGIDFDPVSHAVTIASDAGVFRSNAYPWNNWTDLHLDNGSMQIDSMVADPSNGDVYALSGPRLFRSRDLGRSWELAGPRLPFVRGAYDRNYVIVGGDHRPCVVYRPEGRTWIVARLREAGDGWDTVRTIGPLDSTTVVAHPRVPGVLYTVELTGIGRSVDGGATWTNRPTPHFATYVYVDAYDPDILFANATDGSKRFLLRSSDGGATWPTIPLAADFWIIGPLIGAPTDPNVVYMLAYDLPPTGSFVARSDDRGLTWKRLPNGALRQRTPGSGIHDLAVDPHDPRTVYISTTWHGLFRSTDGGSTWTAMAEGLPDLTYPSIEIDSDGRFVHAGTQSRGVWELPLIPRRRAAGR